MIRGIGYLMAVLVTAIEPITVVFLVGLHWSELPAIARLIIIALQVLFTCAKAKVCSRVGRTEGSARREAVLVCASIKPDMF